jgi:hypothetical protein
LLDFPALALLASLDEVLEFGIPDPAGFSADDKALELAYLDIAVDGAGAHPELYCGIAYADQLVPEWRYMSIIVGIHHHSSFSFLYLQPAGRANKGFILKTFLRIRRRME